ncbi:MAG: sugar ABC transporter permease [Deltaproteobacteria bacterium]|nr:sugar ABC transporter permease [Deltaproteobacteria bacterium]
MSWTRLKEGFSRALDNPNILGFLFVAPAELLLLMFLAYPFILGLWLGVTDTVVGSPGNYIGFENYISLTQDPTFWLIVFNTLFYTVVAVFLKAVLGIGLAVVLNRDFKAKGLVRAIVLLPWIIPTALSAICFWWLYDSTFSGISWALVKLGITDHFIDFLGDPWNARFSLIAANVWRGIPFFTIGLLAGLQTINPDLYEAADIDGAGAWKKFRKITLPLLTPLLTVVTVFSIIWTFADFQLVWIITKGGPANTTHIFGTLSFQRAMSGGHLGEGAAISNFMLPILVACVLIAFAFLRKED